MCVCAPGACACADTFLPLHNLYSFYFRGGMQEERKLLADWILIKVQSECRTGGRSVTSRPCSFETTGRLLLVHVLRSSVGVSLASEEQWYQHHLFAARRRQTHCRWPGDVLPGTRQHRSCKRSIYLCIYRNLLPLSFLRHNVLRAVYVKPYFSFFFGNHAYLKAYWGKKCNNTKPFSKKILLTRIIW